MYISSPTIVTVTLRNIILFVLMKKNRTLNVSHNISHYVQILHNEPFREIRGTVVSISEKKCFLSVSEKFHFVTT